MPYFPVNIKIIHLRNSWLFPGPVGNGRTERVLPDFRTSRHIFKPQARGGSCSFRYLYSLPNLGHATRTLFQLWIIHSRNLLALIYSRPIEYICYNMPQHQNHPPKLVNFGCGGTDREIGDRVSGSVGPRSSIKCSSPQQILQQRHSSDAYIDLSLSLPPSPNPSNASYRWNIPCSNF